MGFDVVGVVVAGAAGRVKDVPLSHCNFFPTLTQVNFLPLALALWPALLHGAPAFTAAIALDGSAKAKITARARALFMRRNLLQGDGCQPANLRNVIANRTLKPLAPALLLHPDALRC